MSAAKASSMLVLFASQTGNSEYIAKNINDEAKKRGFISKCMMMDAYTDSVHEEMTKTMENAVIVFVSSTTGDGDPPDNALKFWRFIRKLTKSNPKPFADSVYTVLGLGDTNYSNFGAHPKKIDKKMSEMGAGKFYTTVIVDEVEGLENAVDPWIESLWPELEKVVQKETSTTTSPLKTAVNEDQVNICTDNVAVLSVLGKSDVSSPSSSLQEEFTSLGRVLPLAWEKSMYGQNDLTGLPKLPAHGCEIHYTSNKRPYSELDLSYFKRQNASITISSDAYSRAEPFMAPLYGVKCLTTAEAVKRTLHVELDVRQASENGWTFQPGDAFGVMPANNDRLVRAILHVLKLEPDAEIELKPIDGSSQETLPSHIKSPCSIYELFRFCLDITGPPRKAFFRQLAEYCVDVEEKKRLLFLCSRQGSALMKECLSMSPTLLDFLTTFPNARPSLSRLIDVLAALAPRYYSITNSPLSYPGFLHCAFNVVQYVTPIAPLDIQRQGVCTTWLDHLSGTVAPPLNLDSTIPVVRFDKDLRVPIFPRPSKDFMLPEDLGKPLILIGPGTGIAPFLGFCQHRIAQKQAGQQVGEIWVFYGCRKKAHDFLYRQEWEQLKQSGIVTRFVAAFSRDVDTDTQQPPSREKYVQHQVMRYANEIVRLLVDEQGLIYVCGDAKGMANDVNETLADVLIAHKDKTGVETKADALKMLVTLMEQKRYCREIWS